MCCFDESEQEIALPEGLSESDLRVVTEESPKPFGRLKLLVNERRWFFLGALNAAKFEIDDDWFEGGEGEEVDA